MHDQRSEENLIGFSAAPGPDGAFFTPDDVPGYDESIVTNQTIKSTTRRRKKYKLVGFFQRNEKVQPNGQTAGRFEPLPATYDYAFPTKATKGELTGTPQRRAAVQPDGWPAVVRRQPLSAGRGEQRRQPAHVQPRDRHESRAAADLSCARAAAGRRPGACRIFPEKFLGGNHTFKAGYQFYWEEVGTAWHTMASGDYRLIFDGVSACRTSRSRSRPTTTRSSRRSTRRRSIRHSCRTSGARQIDDEHAACAGTVITPSSVSR